MADKKRVFFIHPLGANWIPGEKDMSRLANIMPPIGLCSLAAWLDQHGHVTAIHDCYAEPLDDAAMAGRIREFGPDYVGISATTSSFLDGMRLAALAQSAMPGVKIVVGGVHMSALRERLLREYPVIDFGVVGEGEDVFLDLLERDGEDPRGIAGLVARDGDEVYFNGFRPPRGDLDTFPFPAYHKLQGYPARYRLPIFNYPTAPNTTAISSRGCPYQCSYCDRSVFRRSFRFHSAAYMFELTKYLHQRYGIRHINFYDDLFTFHRERVMEFCELLSKSRLHVTFNCAARAEHIDGELLRAMKKAGCWMMSLGIETGDPELLKRHRSNTDLEQTREKVALIRRAGIRTKGLFMLGLPGESEHSIDRSIQYMLSLPLDDFNLAKFTPFPGSPLYEKICEQGTFEENWELMNCLNFVFVSEGLTRERLEEQYREFYRKHFERKRILLSYVAMLWRSPDSWVRFVRNLSDFLSFRKGYR